MKTITIDPRKCVGCRNCEMACAYEKSKSSCEVDFANIRVNDYIEERFVVPMTCFHCEEAWCLKVCPAHAINRDPETNAVILDQTKCAGCKMCILSCPYGNIHFDHEKKVSFKCDLCGGDPRCVTHCISGALQFEEVDDAITRKRVRTDHKIKAMYLDANK
ncbi:4Fe-4S dicluster domain-containing protein [Enterocloster lavalensis]|uniref:4Fe-4S dicluster domain-containing protein n=1 Tax=Enterocloster lavalensis TaxID=460384 RepID=UPI0023F2C643|nr:4Fe-4S dicluster domain-containing protein [Enterocloster lavalensis]